MTKLKPCPFCGNDGIVAHHQHYRTWDRGLWLRKAIVLCFVSGKDGCGASIDKVGPSDEVALDRAVRAWNRRTP